MNKLKNILNDHSHPCWVFIQQFTIRGLLGVKFLILAGMLDPSGVGIISLVLLSLTLIEALTEMGIMQAIVQNKKVIEHYQIIWTLQFVRGFIISFVMILLNELIVNVLNEPAAKDVLLLAAFVPLIRNAASSKYYYEIRNKNFKTISIIYGSSSVFDLVGSILLVGFFKEPIYAIIPLLVSESVKALLTHILFGWTIKFDFRFKMIREVLAYGRWIWGNSISSLFVNQFDKIVVSTFLGAQTLGLYQMGQKMTQLAVADISYAAGQYLFPQFSELFRQPGERSNLKIYYINIVLLMTGFSFLLTSFVFMYSDIIINALFGPSWSGITNLIQLMMIGSSLSAITYISVIYNRAIGKPKKVTVVSYVQLVLSVLLSLVFIKFFNVEGLIISGIITNLMSNILLNASFGEKLKCLKKSLTENLSTIIVNTGILLLFYLIYLILPFNLGFLLNLGVFCVGSVFLGRIFLKRRPVVSVGPGG
ncbi:polysaccharide biosynthesis protein [Paenibacillus darwinianus]|uniref:Polysaccharide biosynthesis protein n=1 Tax=Paenibacillus darwinianus TaxID=1380763 RepID=A0A9W5S2Z7_9BACL|nr:oligosaccharide flippase family protein [Paenibacillus darwinianus]EXX91449.1 polysaccharide biosynthesis protein [Paenibacillus darwinianus]